KNRTKAAKTLRHEYFLAAVSDRRKLNGFDGQRPPLQIRADSHTDDGLFRFACGSGASRRARTIDPDLFQKWPHRLFASEKLLNRFVDITRIAHCVNFIS